MTKPVKPPADPALPNDLPAVEPPTAGFIVQLFLIPAAIVAVVVLVYLLFGQIASSRRSPADYLADLRGANRERRWLAAHELALMLPRDKNWQNDQVFATELSEELDREIAGSDGREQEVEYQKYLAMALGEFNSADVLPALGRTMEVTGNPDVQWAAILSVGRLSERFGGLKDDAVMTRLAALAQDDDAKTRSLVAFVLGSTERDDAVTILERLLGDSDRDVRYNAAASLARLGSPAGLDVIAEMLDDRKLEQGGVGIDQREIIAVAALESLDKLIERRPVPALGELRPLILAQSHTGGPAARTSAKKALIRMDQHGFGS